MVQCASFGGLGVNDRGTADTAFWFRGQNNVIRNNVAADHHISGFSINAYRLGNDTTRVPVSQGSLEKEVVNMNSLPILEFDNNETYGPSFYGADIWEIGSTGETLWDVDTSTIKNITIWHTFNKGLFFYRSHRIVIDGITIRGDAQKLKSRFLNPVGISLHSAYRQRHFVVRNADIQGVRDGISVNMRVIPNDMPEGSIFNQLAPPDRSGIIAIEDSYLRNYRDISVQTRWKEGSPRQTHIRNVRFERVDMTEEPFRVGPQRTIALNFDFGLDANAIAEDSVLVFDHNGTIGDDFQVFYPEQDPAFIVPQTTNNGRSVGSPEAGLTNQQNWDTYGIAIAGGLAPCLDDTTRPQILGFTCPIGAVVPDPDPDPDPDTDTDTDTTPPSVPQLVSAEALSETVIYVSWSAATDNEAVVGYRVFSGNVQLADTTDLSFTHTGLQPATAYSYSVLAYDAAGNVSDRSQVVTVTTKSQQPTEATVTLVARDQLGQAVVDGNIRITGQSSQAHGSTAMLTVGKTYTFRGELGSAKGAYQTITVSGTTQEIVAPFWTVDTTPRDQLGNVVADAQFQISGSDPFTPEASLSYPLGAKISIRGRLGRGIGAWQRVTFGEGLTEIGSLFWTVDSIAHDQMGNVVAGAQLQISGSNPFTPESTFTYPLGAKASIRGRLGRGIGAWQRVTFAEGLTEIGSLFWTADATPHDQFGNVVSSAQLQISGSDPFTPEATFTYPLGARASIRGRLERGIGAWQQVTFAEGLTEISGLFWTVDSIPRDQLGNEVFDVQLQISGSAPFTPEATFTYPLGARASIRGIYQGNRTPWTSFVFVEGLTEIGAIFPVLD